MERAASLTALALALSGCATVAPERRVIPSASPARPGDGFSESDLPVTDDGPPRAVLRDDEVAAFDLQARLAARARSMLGRRGPFRAGGERFGGDCSGFVQAVYEAEGISLREIMQRVAPDERGGVKAAWQAAKSHGGVFGGGAWPAPGDLVFWHDTYDRNRNGKADDPLTHLGIVEYVEDGTVYFLHRGGRGVARGVMTLERPYDASAEDGRHLNSALRAKTHPVKAAGLAGTLFAGYGRIDPARVPVELASGRIDPVGEAIEDEAEGPAANRAATATPDRDPPTTTTTATATTTATTTPTPTPTPTATRTATAIASRKTSAKSVTAKGASAKSADAKRAGAAAAKKKTKRAKKTVARAATPAVNAKAARPPAPADAAR